MEKYKHKFSAEEIVGWIVIGLMIATAIWMLSGSPTQVGAIIGIFGFVATSEILLWKNLFKIDKRTEIGFMKVKHDMELMENNIMNKLNNIEGRLK